MSPSMTCTVPSRKIFFLRSAVFLPASHPPILTGVSHSHATSPPPIAAFNLPFTTFSSPPPLLTTHRMSGLDKLAALPHRLTSAAGEISSSRADDHWSSENLKLNYYHLIHHPSNLADSIFPVSSPIKARTPTAGMCERWLEMERWRWWPLHPSAIASSHAVTRNE